MGAGTANDIQTMRIAYITTYQGPSLLKSRPIVRNRSLSNAVKIESVASLLRERSYEVEVISQGEVVENGFKFYPSLSESQRFHREIPIYYASALSIRRLNGLWSSLQTLELFKARHRAAPFNLVVIFNLKEPQVTCAKYAIRRLGLPVILEYEDDRFVDVGGEVARGITSRMRNSSCKKLLKMVSGCLAVSPELLSQVPESTPKMLLRGVACPDIVEASKHASGTKRNWILFSGTHVENNGVAQLIEAWRLAPIAGWELHITGKGELTDSLREMAKNVSGVNFHGLVSRQELVKLMCSARICINPYVLSRKPGNLFAFKVIEYLSAGAHCVTTPMGFLEQNLEHGITYLPDNAPATIAATLKKAIEDRHYERSVAGVVQEVYGATGVAERLDQFIRGLVREGPLDELSFSYRGAL
jgi:glycosyltransferase involved in cell wall biosynthesis